MILRTHMNCYSNIHTCIHYVQNTSELVLYWYFEIPKYLTSVEDIDAGKVKSLFNNKSMTLEETEGKSLKVMFRTGTEVKFCGFVTAGDASRELDDSDVENVYEHARKGKIVKAISPSELVAMW